VLEAERIWMAMAESKLNTHDSSGSCAIILLQVDRECYVANVGDSRAIMSAMNGKKLFLLSRDHKPSDESEK
jgi:protein phosphatase PTC2/3